MLGPAAVAKLLCDVRASVLVALGLKHTLPQQIGLCCGDKCGWLIGAAHAGRWDRTSLWWEGGKCLEK